MGALRSPTGIVGPAHAALSSASFVREGQPATAEIEAFTFTRHGTIADTVVIVSGAAVADEKLLEYFL